LKRAPSPEKTLGASAEPSPQADEGHVISASAMASVIGMPV